MTTALVFAVNLAMAAALLWAALEKARSLTSFAAVLRQLGVTRRAREVALGVVLLELGVAMGLIYRPDAITLVLLVALALAFSMAGVIALVRKTRVTCGCFGPYGRGELGVAQLVALPFWLGGALVLHVRGEIPSVEWRTTWFGALVALTIATIRTLSAVGPALTGRGDRRSARDMHPWLTW